MVIMESDEDRVLEDKGNKHCILAVSEMQAFKQIKKEGM